MRYRKENRTMPKRKWEKIHSRKNALIRYGIDCGPKMRKALIEKIQNEEAIFLNSSSNRRRVFAVCYKGNWYPIVYDNKRKEIITFLPSNYLKKYQNKIALNKKN